MYLSKINIFIMSAIAVSYLMLKLFKIHKDKTSQDADKKVDEEKLDEKEKAAETIALHTPVLKQKSKKKIRKKEKQNMQYLRPNFFLGFQIFDAGIHQKVKKLQEKIIAKNPKLHSALVNISTLHVTLAVTHLGNEEDIESFKEKLNEWAGKNETFFFQEPVTLSFTGIKTFKNLVAYLDIEPSESKEKLLNLSKSMNNMLSSAGFSTDKRDFTPHVTILKLSKNPKLLRFKKSFHDDFESLKNCKDHFGKQEISNLQLLSMDEPKDEKGYYKCFHQIFVRDQKIDWDHNDCCSLTPKHRKLTSDTD